MIEVCEIATVVAVTQVIVRLGERAARDIENTRKLCGPEPAEPFSDVSRG